MGGVRLRMRLGCVLVSSRNQLLQVCESRLLFLLLPLSLLSRPSPRQPSLIPLLFSRLSAFMKCRFVVDQFHAPGHSTCSLASALAEAMLHLPELNGLNGSAAERGNLGVARIRKTLSYMSEEHAILYTKVRLFLSFHSSFFSPFISLPRLFADTLLFPPILLLGLHRPSEPTLDSQEGGEGREVPIRRLRRSRRVGRIYLVPPFSLLSLES